MNRILVLPRPVETEPAQPTEAPELDGGFDLIPRLNAPAPVGHRRCPTLPGNLQSLVRQTIALADCEQRQCEGYHKCFQCVYRDRSPFRGKELPPVENASSRLAAARKNQAVSTS